MAVLAVREHIPLEQGLRLRVLATGVGEHTVREHIPLEQGLRLNRCRSDQTCCQSVREHIPLEQGLRQYSPLILSSKLFGQRAYSIRTRIKTRHILYG